MEVAADTDVDCDPSLMAIFRSARLPPRFCQWGAPGALDFTVSQRSEAYHMHEIKKLNFARSYPGRSFPAHRDLSLSEVEEKRKHLSINGMTAESRASLTRMVDCA